MNVSQTKITPQVKEITLNFKSLGLERIFEILEWIHKNSQPISDKSYKDKNFRRRTSDEIITSGKYTGCTDYALVFLSLIRASKFEAKYIEAISTDWLKEGGSNIKGHIFVEVKINNKWIIVDPQGALIKAWYGKKFIIYKKGKDSWDIGIKNLKDLKQKFNSFRKEYL